MTIRAKTPDKKSANENGAPASPPDAAAGPPRAEIPGDGPLGDGSARGGRPQTPPPEAVARAGASRDESGRAEAPRDEPSRDGAPQDGSDRTPSPEASALSGAPALPRATDGSDPAPSPEASALPRAPDGSDPAPSPEPPALPGAPQDGAPPAGPAQAGPARARPARAASAPDPAPPPHPFHPLDPALNAAPEGDLRGRRVHLLGAGGVAMAALASLMVQAGAEVTGSDLDVYPPSTWLLDHMRIRVHRGWDGGPLRRRLDGSRPDLVVVGNVVTRGLPVVGALAEEGLPYLSLPQALRRWFLEGTLTLVVAGCHGKTTATNLCAQLLDRGGLAPGFLIGGASLDFRHPCRTGKPGGWFAVEGDEYDCAFFDKRPKFLHYKPDMAILTSVEYDHADIYPDQAAVRAAYLGLMELIPPKGLLIARGDDPAVREVAAAAPCPKLWYGPEGAPSGPGPGGRLDLVVRDWRPRGMGSTFNLVNPFGPPIPVVFNRPGLHNALNAAAAAGAYLAAAGKPSLLPDALSAHRGVKRRQEVLGSFGRPGPDVTLIDDFAHHPTAVARTLEAIRGAYPGRPLVCAFEPRSNTTRRAVFQDDYPPAFKEADRVFLAPVDQPGKAPPGDRLDLDRLAADIGPKASVAEDVNSLAVEISAAAKPGDVVVIMSNGGFGGLGTKLSQRLAARFGSSAARMKTQRSAESSEAPSSPEELAEKMGLRFLSLDQLRSALTHRSIQGVTSKAGEDQETDNQRLEFLGDAVLDMMVAELLFPVRPRLSEGHMTRLRAWLVCEARLAEVAKSLDLGSHLIMAPSERAAGGRYKSSVLADALEAVVAAVYLDLGYDAAKSLVSRLWAPYMTREILMTGHNDYKTSLQEFTQSMRMGLPSYSLTGTTGEAHRQVFTAQVRLLDAVFEGRGTTRKEAEQEAAKLMLEHLKVVHGKA